MSMRSLLTTLAALVGVLVVLSLAAVVIERMNRSTFSPFEGAPESVQLQVNADGVIVPPPMTAAMRATLAESEGFQVLVSYTDRGFEPRSFSIESGETVRFTNNSTREVWVASSGTPYPQGEGTCGQSAFDSCAALRPLDFWEFTFDEAGEWEYTDNLHKEFSGTVRVQ